MPEGTAVVTRGESVRHLHALFEKFHYLIILLEESEIVADSM